MSPVSPVSPVSPGSPVYDSLESLMHSLSLPCPNNESCFLGSSDNGSAFEDEDFSKFGGSHGRSRCGCRSVPRDNDTVQP